MKCRRCRGPAVIDVRRHNAAFCGECFVPHCHEQVRRAIDRFDMLDAVATGHNLDAVAAVLFGNVLRWEEGYLGRQYPVLPPPVELERVKG